MGSYIHVTTIAMEVDCTLQEFYSQVYKVKIFYKVAILRAYCKKMTSQRTFTVYCLLTTLICTVTALKCTKLVSIDGNMDEQIFTEGLYAVNTTPTNSTEIRELAASLQDSNGLEFDVESFVATLQPRDVKKVSYIDQACCC